MFDKFSGYFGKKRMSAIFKFVILCAICAPIIYPFLWMIGTSLKSEVQIYTYPPKLFPWPVHFENYVEVTKVVPFWRWLLNTLFLVVMNVTGTLLSTSMAAYGFAKLRAPGKNFLFSIVLATMMVPGIVTMIPVYLMFRDLGWIDTFKPLWVPAFFAVATGDIFLFRQFFLTFPNELDDAAKIDGANPWQIFFHIYVPLSKPAFATIGFFSFSATWSSYIGPLIYLNSEEKWVLALGLQAFQSQYGTMWNLLMAYSVIMIVPLIIGFFWVQRYFKECMILTGLK